MFFSRKVCIFLVGGKFVWWPRKKKILEDAQFLHFGPKLDQSLALKPPNIYFNKQSYGSPLNCFRKIPTRIKHLEFLGLLFYLWKFQTKQSFTPGNSAKLCCTHWKFQGQNARPMGIPHYFCLMTPGNSCSPHFHFTCCHSKFKIKLFVLWNFPRHLW